MIRICSLEKLSWLHPGVQEFRDVWANIKRRRALDEGMLQEALHKVGVPRSTIVKRLSACFDFQNQGTSF